MTDSSSSSSSTTAKPSLILAMCNPLLDMQAKVDLDYVQQYDLQVNVAILAEDKHLPIYKELPEKFEVEYVAGGSAQNTIRVAQWFLETPHATSYIGCVGKDTYAETLRAETEKCKVRALYQEDESTPTGTCAVLVTGKERTLIANIAAANKFHISHLEKPHVWSVIEATPYFYVSGFFLTVSPPSILKIAQHAAEKDKIFSMNLSAPFICQFFKQPLLESLEYADYFFGNETEAKAFAEANGLTTTDPTEIALKIAAMPKKSNKRSRIVVITQGSEPTIVATEGKTTHYPVDKIEESGIVDTNGAGDAFVGGFLAQLALEKSIEECVRAGHWAARIIIQRSGCSLPEGPCTFK